ncbi:zinc transporter ZIP3 isoform X1 [Pieris brassicae]|uniref:zinc transporter ZIP3 isoform X1 n=1 Tax=Pieris brassicae TaxID=7116 RepID=UPI001E65ECD9|nr:zinc transporter ZIP3 isoform X1 [Pieris brassicae]
MEVSTAKVISMLALGLGSFGAGMAPVFISERARQRHPLLISCLLCFGGGVLLSTSLTHILPEAREMLGKYSELGLCVGFFLVYFVDELVHLFYGANNNIQRERTSYGTEESHLLRDDEMRERCGGAADNPRMCHVSHKAPCNKSYSGVIGLLCALLVHSFLEGLAIGLQETASQVLLLLAAVACHKFVVGFCLGAELCANGRSLSAHIVSILLFSGGSVAGIGVGAGLDAISQLKNSVVVSIMQALAAGTLLYVTVSEVLPRERARWHEQKRSAGVAQFFAVTTGFAVMYLSTMYLDHDAD